MKYIRKRKVINYYRQTERHYCLRGAHWKTSQAMWGKSVHKSACHERQNYYRQAEMAAGVSHHLGNKCSQSLTTFQSRQHQARICLGVESTQVGRSHQFSHLFPKPEADRTHPNLHWDRTQWKKKKVWCLLCTDTRIFLRMLVTWFPQCIKQLYNHGQTGLSLATWGRFSLLQSQVMTQLLID